MHCAVKGTCSANQVFTFLMPECKLRFVICLNRQFTSGLGETDAHSSLAEASALFLSVAGSCL